MRRRLALESETCHHAIREPSEGRGDSLAVSQGAETLCQCPGRRGELKYASRVCPPRTRERPRALCLRCLTVKAGDFRGCSGGAVLPPVGHAGLRPGLWFKPGAKQTRLWTLLALLCAYVAWENIKTHSPALTRNPENRLRPLEVNKRLKKISLREVSWKVPQFGAGRSGFHNWVTLGKGPNLLKTQVFPLRNGLVKLTHSEDQMKYM